ncbi:hydantoinase/oxoprolinase family protein [Tatumella terrea]|uniref:Hydantoinase/oxoprolinase family protein n=1 Tax=Tatumella terrea TaxID=419007 RepID=A0ABW1VXH1_9GAMM
MNTARIGVDIGGTFTDLVLLGDNGETFFTKVPSTPAKPEQAVLTGIKRITDTAGVEVSQITEVVHGTTVGSNTLLQKVGAKTGLITTKGFRDVLEIGRVRTPTMFDLSWEKAVPLISRQYRMEVDERSTADGRILKPLDENELLKIGEFFLREGVESVAICFLNSYRNPENEKRALDFMSKNFPDLYVTASVSVLPEIREYERTSTTAVNAYVLPSLRAYFARLDNGLKEIGVSAPLLISNSNGGLSSAAMAQEKPVFFISSGRSAGVVGAGRLGEAMGEKDLVVFDMGGTTASASLIYKGELARANEYEFRAGISTPSRFIKAGGYLMRVPTVDVAEVGSGAGSIARIDEGGLMHVGPLSAGADPGPVCYGIGGKSPTVTDANVVLGFLPALLAGGTMSLDVTGARAAIERELAAPLGLSVEDAAFGIREVANINMARTIKAVTVERGVDPRNFTLLAFGGSGPVHACDLARTLGIKRVIFPKSPGVFTATGMLAARVERYFLRPLNNYLDEVPVDQVNTLLNEMQSEALTLLADEGYSEGQVEFNFEGDLRFKGQDFELPITFPEHMTEGSRDDLHARFSEAYKGIYGYASDDRVEVVNIRLNARGISNNSLQFSAQQPAPSDTKPDSRKIYFSRDDQWVDTPVYERSHFKGGVPGPMIIQSPDTTIVIPPRAQADLDAFGNVIATLA